MSYKASAPGSLMLMGEYAVLHDKKALVCAVDKRVTVTVAPQQDLRVQIISKGYGEWTCDLSSLSLSPPFHFVTACLYRYRQKMKTGCLIEIDSELSDQVGLGSSAAVTVATLAALFSWLGEDASPRRLIREARMVIREVQGVGSGADVAASVLGGVVAYRSQPLEVEKFSLSLPLTVVYSGAKTPTVLAIQKVREYFSAFPEVFNALCHSIEACVKEAVQALRDQDWLRLGKAMNIQQGLMQALGVSTSVLDAVLARLHTESEVLGAKISGSGLGDCVIGLGETQLKDARQLFVKMTVEGVKIL